MKNSKKLFAAVTAIALLFSLVNLSVTKPSTPEAARTGAPSEKTCASSSCHSGTADTGPGNVAITFSNPNLTYIPGDTFQVTVTVTDDTKTRWGFEMTDLKADNSASAGTWLKEVSGVAISKPTISTFPLRNYVSHKDANTTVSSWTINWIAPASNIGNVCFYAAGMGSNNTGGSGGDNVYTTSLCIAGSFGTGALVIDDQNSTFKVQSLVYNRITLEYFQMKNEHVSIQLFDLNGRLIQQIFDGNVSAGLQNPTFRLNDNVTSGMYLINYSSPGQKEIRKIYIQK